MEIKENFIKQYLGKSILKKLVFINDNIEFLKDHTPLRIDDIENETTHIFFIDYNTFKPSLNFENYTNFRKFSEFYKMNSLLKLNMELDSKIENILFYKNL